MANEKKLNDEELASAAGGMNNVSTTGNVGGNVNNLDESVTDNSINAGGDIVGGDKTDVKGDQVGGNKTDVDTDIKTDVNVKNSIF